MRYDKRYNRREGPLVVTKVDKDTGSVLIVSITQVRTENIDYSEKDQEKLKGDG